ncbi:MAG: hypothetical protein PHP04_04685 [Bacteroidales bacterium]|nr:hypothetical protein [Bacteroidales bacterium]HNW74468.1 hypothetical protein [Bacteroidales bacterium]HPS50605.1 hypothetical protein [Bacteroidales bacterium]
METLSHIIASFDIFQVILQAFPKIFNPIVHALEGLFTTLFNFFGNMISVHPGLLSGIVIFLAGYLVYNRYQKIRKSATSSLPVSPRRSL